MHVHFGVELLSAEWSESVVCIGTFDGVHLGHQQVIGQAVRTAGARELPCILVTFDRHPAAILAPERCPRAIAPIESNLRQFERLGVAVALVLPFNYELSQTSATDFYENVLAGKLHAKCLVVGHDFAFGHDREGTPEWLKERVETHVIEPHLAEGVRISSSAIRKAIEEGDVARATHLLGRPFELAGVVVKGQQLGRTLGFPTINLAKSMNQVCPADGIYAGWCDTPVGTFKAAISVGYRPTVGGKQRTVEAYLLEYGGDSLYGAAVNLAFNERLRDELHFANLDELKEQMARDVERVSLVI